MIREGKKDPLPEIVISDVAMYFPRQGRINIAAAWIIQYDLYARLAETLQLCPDDIFRPSRGTHGRVLVNFGNSDLGLSTKTNQQDDASVELGFRVLEPTPHSPRHSGPSNDLLLERMHLLDAQKRGRWVSARSVQRYEKHARVIRQLERLSPSQHRRATTSQSALLAALLAAVTPPKNR